MSCFPTGRAAWLDGGPIRSPSRSTASPCCIASRSSTGRSCRSRRTLRRPTSLPTSWPRSPMPAVRRGSSPRPGRARPGCSPSAPATCLRMAAAGKRCAWCVQQAGPGGDARPHRRPAGPAGPHAQRLALAIVNGVGAVRAAAGHADARSTSSRCAGSSASWSSSRGERNTDPAAPWIEALSLARLGLRDPSEVEALYDGDVDGFADVLPLYRAELGRHGARLRRADLARHRDAARRGRRACRRAARLPGAARRRVPGPHAGPPPARAAAGRTRRLRCSAWATTTRRSTATTAPTRDG